MPPRAAGLEWTMRSGLDRGSDLDRKVEGRSGASRCAGVFWLGDSAGVTRAEPADRGRTLRVATSRSDDATEEAQRKWIC
jgi:hypothetical protein